MTPRLLQLIAVRAQIDAMIAAEQGESQMVGGPLTDIATYLESVEGCQHPEERRVVSHNMGEDPQFWCPECKTFVKGVA